MPNSVGIIPGDRAAHEMSMRFGGYIANTTLLAALPLKSVITGQVWALPEGLYRYDALATNGGVACTAGGRFLPLGTASGDQSSIYHVRAASTADVPNLALCSVTMDTSVTLVAGDRVLLKDQATSAQNGIYSCGAVTGGVTTVLTRASDFDSAAEVKPNSLIVVREGTANADLLFQCTTDGTLGVITPGTTTPLTFTAYAVTPAAASTITVVDAADYYTAVNAETTLAEIGARRLQTRTATIGHADLTNAVNGSAETENVGVVLPANARIVGCDVLLTTPFTGGAVAACVLDVGVAGAIESLIKDLDVLGSAGATSYAGGQVPSTATRPRGAYGGAQIIATFTPDGGNPLVDLTAGALTITVDFFLPGKA